MQRTHTTTSYPTQVAWSIPTHIFAPPAWTVSATPAVCVEQGFSTGTQIGVFYDPMVAKLIMHGADHTEALWVLRVALEDYHIISVSTNIVFLHALAGHPAFISAEVRLYPSTVPLILT